MRGAGLQAWVPALAPVVVRSLRPPPPPRPQPPDAQVKATDFGLSIRHRPEDPPLKSRSGAHVGVRVCGGVWVVCVCGWVGGRVGVGWGGGGGSAEPRHFCPLACH